MSAGGSAKAIVAALLANLGIAVTKIGAFAITGSSAMLAEGIHSFADTGNQALLLLGGKRAKKEADVEHPFGFGRERYFWAFVVAIVLFTLGSLFAIYEGIHKLQHPEPLESPLVAIVVLVIALGLEGFSFRTAVHESRPLKGRASWPQFIRRSKNPELPVVLLEDFGALIGLVIALFAVSMDAVTHNPAWDAWGSIVIGVLLGAIAIVLAVEMKSLLIGEAASPEQEHQISEAIRAVPQCKDLLSLRTQHFGPDDVLVAVKIEFDDALDMRELAASINQVEAEIRAIVPTARYIYVEPDIRRTPAGDPAPAEGAGPG